MFIELTEFLRCPRDHPQAHCVLVPHEMSGRSVWRGVIGCPVCHAEYPIADGVVRFGPGPHSSTELPLPDAATLQALLGIATPGGHVVLLGSAGRAAPALATLIGGVHFVGVNAPAAVGPAPSLSLLEASDGIPLRNGMARGVVAGAEFFDERWSAECARVLLNGLRLVVLGGEALVGGMERLAGGPGIWVGQKRDQKKGTRVP